MSVKSISGHLSCENQLSKKDFFDLVVDGVHSLNPFHLILRFQLLCHALLRLHLAGQLLQPFLTGAVDFLQVFYKSAGEQKPRVQSWAMFFEIAQAHPSGFALWALFCFGQANVGQQVVSVSMIGELHDEILAFRCLTSSRICRISMSSR